MKRYTECQKLSDPRTPQCHRHREISYESIGWVEHPSYCSPQRILLVTGPAGIGKTTTVRVVAHELGIDLMEWSESIEERGLGSGFGE